MTSGAVAGKIEVGYKKAGVGVYTIVYTMSGGTLDGDGQRLMIATGASSRVATGKFIVDCSGVGNPLGGYSLTYTYDSDCSANDIALVPELGTLILLGLGGLLARPKK